MHPLYDGKHWWVCLTDLCQDGWCKCECYGGAGHTSGGWTGDLTRCFQKDVSHNECPWISQRKTKRLTSSCVVMDVSGGVAGIVLTKWGLWKQIVIIGCICRKHPAQGEHTTSRWSRPLCSGQTIISHHTLSNDTKSTPSHLTAQTQHTQNCGKCTMSFLNFKS